MTQTGEAATLYHDHIPVDTSHVSSGNERLRYITLPLRTVYKYKVA